MLIIIPVVLTRRQRKLGFQKQERKVVFASLRNNDMKPSVISMSKKDLLIMVQPFQRNQQNAVKRLILDGLVEHWGYCDPTLNSDLNDIAAHYASATFLVAKCDEQIVGSGALVPQTTTVAEIVRMSVASEFRRQGIATIILERLCRNASAQGYRRLTLETSAAWGDVIAFYQNFGFRITHEQEGEFGRDVYFSLALPLKTDEGK